MTYNLSQAVMHGMVWSMSGRDPTGARFAPSMVVIVEVTPDANGNWFLYHVQKIGNDIVVKHVPELAPSQARVVFSGNYYAAVAFLVATVSPRAAVKLESGYRSITIKDFDDDVSIPVVTDTRNDGPSFPSLRNIRYGSHNLGDDATLEDPITFRNVPRSSALYLRPNSDGRGNKKVGHVYSHDTLARLFDGRDVASSPMTRHPIRHENVLRVRKLRKRKRRGM